MTGREGLCWRRASHSSNTGDNCVEVASELAGRAVRDSKHPAGSRLVFDTAPFDTFLTWLKVAPH